MDNLLNPHTLRAAVEAEARRLGFDLFGVTTPDPPPHWSVFAAWLAEGRHGAMAYLAAEQAQVRRADPRQVLPGCRSIVVLARRYEPPVGQPVEEASPAGRIAAYARDEDYHDSIGEQLERLVNFIESRVGGPVPNRRYVDTGPVLERDLAQRAGLGWIGKNTCLIHPRLGSYFFLAEIFLGIELSFDQPFVFDRCGVCTRCLDACPTGCILPDRTIDARRCISYLTIELKEEIPADLRSNIGGWVFGCDICQQVCPWNRRVNASGDAGDPQALPASDLARELSLSPEEFNRKYKGRSMKRAKRRGYLRNIAVVLGNLGDAGALPALAHSLSRDPEPLVRAHAAWALGNLRQEAAFNILMDALAHETDPGVRREIENALEK